MADYAITGKKGTGKSKLCVRIIRDALRSGRRVATNLDLKLEYLLPPNSRATVIRIPDKPTAADLFAIGHGNPDSYDEEKNGILVLDELGTWLNTRNFQDKDRMPVLDWLIHARKHGWDVYYLMQHINQVDKQVREALCEYVGRCVRFDKVNIPLIGPLIRTVSFGLLSGRFPRFHMCNIRMGSDPLGVLVDRVVFRGDDLHKGYDTRQVFSPLYPHGVFSMLSAWHVKGRYHVPKQHPLIAALRDWWDASASRQARRRQLLATARKKCLPLMNLPPDLRWHAARTLVQKGLL